MATTHKPKAKRIAVRTCLPTPSLPPLAPRSFIPHGRVAVCNPGCKRRPHHFGPCLGFTLEDVAAQPEGEARPFGSMARMIEEGRVQPKGWVWKGWEVIHEGEPR